MTVRSQSLRLAVVLLIAASNGFADDPPQTEIIEGSEATDEHTIPAHLLHKAPGLSVYFVSNHFKVYPNDPFDEMGGEVRSIGFGLGEYEPFQMVVCSDKPLPAVTVRIIGLPQGVSYECQPVGLVDIKRSRVRAGLTPDPLHNDPAFDIEAGGRQSFWMTLHATRKATAGPFMMRCAVMSGDRTLARFVLPARVWNFPIPLRPHLASMIEFRPWNRSSHYPDLFNWPVEQQAKIYRKYYKWYHRNRIQPGAIFPRPVIRKDDQGEYHVLNGEDVNRYFQQFRQEFPGTFDVLWIQRLIGHTQKHWLDPDTEEGMEKILHVRGYLKAYVEMARKYDWPLERFVWYAGDEPIMPHARRGDGSSKDLPIKTLNVAIRTIRPVLHGMPIFVSAWPFDRELLSVVDIWPGRSYATLNSPMPRMQTVEAVNYGKAVALTTDNSYNILMDREAINHRLDPLHAWYADLPMIEHWSNMFWQKKPWNPDEWFSKTFIVPGDGNLVYPPPNDEEVVSCIRAELMREGMEDYEYLWLLRHASWVIRNSPNAGEECDLLELIDNHLWDARDWIVRNSPSSSNYDYIGLCGNIPGSRLRSAALELDLLREAIQETLAEVNKKGYFQPEQIDAGQKPIRQWFRHD